MSETTTVDKAAATAANKASKAAGATVAAVSDTLPTVVETVEVVTTVPSRVVVKQPLIVLTAAFVGGLVGAGVFYGAQKWRNRNKVVVAVDKPDSDEFTSNA